MQTFNTTYGALSGLGISVWTGSVTCQSVYIQTAVLSCCANGVRVGLGITHYYTNGTDLRTLNVNQIQSNYHYDDYVGCGVGCIYAPSFFCASRIVTRVRLYSSTTFCASSDFIKIKLAMTLYEFDGIPSCIGSPIDIV